MLSTTPAKSLLQLLAITASLLATALTIETGQAEEPPSPLQAEINKVESLIPAANELLLKLQNDPLRPKYHFTAPWGWINDPNGPIFWKGRYHLFYQFYPHAAYWKSIQWGHASSKDLIHWTHHPVALAPEPGKPDWNGCYSGGAVINNGVPTLVYLGVPKGICIATSTDDELIHWTKHPQNPVIPYPRPEEQKEYKVFDPCVWQHNGTWYALSGWGRCFARPNEPEGDIAYLFKSPDLVNWEYLHPFYASNRGWTEADEDCAVPNFFPLGDKHVLLFASHKRGAQYYVGRYQDDKFMIEQHARLNWTGGQLIAPNTMLDDKGRRIFFGWVQEGRDQDTHRAAGWAGMMTIPRVLTLATDGKEPLLRMSPAPEIENLRLTHQRQDGFALAADSHVTVAGIRGDCLEIQVVMDATEAAQFGLIVRASPDGAEQTRIYYDATAKQLKVDGSKSGLVLPQRPRVPFLPEQEKNVQVQAAPFELSTGEPLRLRVFIDRSIVEVFANERQSLTQRIYPTRSDSLDVGAFSTGGRATVKFIEAWDMAATGSF